MAIRDLLWACPECGMPRGLRASSDCDQCVTCGMTFRREDGSRIVGARPGGEEVVLPASQWVDRLPEMAAVVDAEVASPEADVEARFAVGTAVVRNKNQYLGQIEQFGPICRGTVAIQDGALRFTRTESDSKRHIWTFDVLTAIQASSSTLQLKFRGEPVISLRFPGGSLRYWELRLQHAVQRYYEETSRGTIREFQPRIVTR